MKKKLATQVVSVRDCAVCFTVSQREILRAARRAQAKLANREKPRVKRQPRAKRGTNLRVSSGVRGALGRVYAEFCSNNAVGDGVMSNSRKRKTERPEL